MFSTGTGHLQRTLETILGSTRLVMHPLTHSIASLFIGLEPSSGAGTGTGTVLIPHWWITCVGCAEVWIQPLPKQTFPGLPFCIARAPTVLSLSSHLLPSPLLLFLLFSPPPGSPFLLLLVFETECHYVAQSSLRFFHLILPSLGVSGGVTMPSIFFLSGCFCFIYFCFRY